MSMYLSFFLRVISLTRSAVPPTDLAFLETPRVTSRPTIIWARLSAVAPLMDTWLVIIFPSRSTLMLSAMARVSFSLWVMITMLLFWAFNSLKI